MFDIHVIALVVALILNAAANLMMKIGMNRIEISGGLFQSGPVGAITSVVTNPVLMIGLTCFGLNVFCYMFALQSKALKISIAYPLMVGGGFAIIATVGYFWLHEQMNLTQKLGVALILIGVVVVASQMDSETT